MGIDDLVAKHAAPVTPNDGANLSQVAKALFVGTGGNVTATPEGAPDGTSVVFKNLASGSILPVRVKRVWVASTAADMLALYD